MSVNPFSLVGKTILVTGASSGIGRATVTACANMGAELILTGRNEKELINVASEARISGSNNVNVISGDLTDDSFLESIAIECPILDGLVSNAGVGGLMPVQSVTRKEMNRICGLDFFSPMLLLRQFLRRKKLHKGSSVVLTCSTAGVYRVSAGNAIYAAAKSGLDAFMRTAALELGPRGVRVNSVNPGMVETRFITGGLFSDEQLEVEKRNYPLGRFAKPEEVAYGIVFLLSDASSFITGTALKIDGGMTLK